MEIEKQDFEHFDQCVKDKDLYLFGASKSAQNFILRNSQYCIKGFFDNNESKWNKEYIGYKVYSLDVLNNLDRDKTIILITSVYEEEIEIQLKKLGYHYIFSSHMCERDGIMNWLTPIKEEDYKNIRDLHRLLEDDLSQKRLNEIVANRAENRQYWNGMFDGTAYFNNILGLTEREVFVDGGAFNGDTIDGFLNYTKNQYERIYAFEPDPINYKLLTNKYCNEKNILCKNSGLWSKATILNFKNQSNEGSKISKEGNYKISVNSIDNLKDNKISFIKMDIEGAELEALQGAKETIKELKPKLAICIYHKYDDLWRIPFYIKNLVPEYKLYIRHHSLGGYDTVLYAKI